MAIDSVVRRILEKGSTQAGHPAYFVKTDGRWVPTPWSEYANQVRETARALIANGFEMGHTTCILGFNRAEWLLFDVATMAAGGAPAGIYTTCSPDEVQYIIGHSEAQIVLVENASQWEKINQERKRLPKLKLVVVMDGGDEIDDPLVIGWDAFLATGEGVEESVLDDRIEQLTEEQTATFIYTSGTTGPPKAVMLTHQNLIWTAQVAVDLTDLTRNDCSVSYLPLSHIAEQMFSVHGPAISGGSIYFAESLDAVAENLKEVQPTVIFGVPRIWEKFYAGITAKLKLATGAKAKLVSWAQSVGTEVSKCKNAGKEPGTLLALQYKLATKLIFSKLKPAIGLGNARICVSGAAPIAAEILQFFAGLDIVIYEVYGQSEDSGPTTFNVPGATRYGTVGRAIPGVDVKIAEDGEILVRGPNVFAGYYKDKAATDDALIDGWLYSGDLGSFDDDGFLTITGRKKDIIITAGGKNIAPKNIEAALKNHELISEAVVIGDRRRFLSCLITVDPEALERWAKDNGQSVENAHANEKLIAEIQASVDEVNTLFAQVEHIRKFTVLDRQLTIDDGELTPTLKVKRKIVNENFAELIEAMYA